MAGAARQLAPGEELVWDLHPHWRRLVVPFVVVPVVAGATTLALLTGPAEPPFRVLVLAVAFLLLLALALLPYLRWRSTRYLVTDRRVAGRAGIVTAEGQDLPLAHVDELHYEQTLVGRLFRSGDLVLDSDDEAGGLRLVDVPRVVQVARSVAALVDARRARDEDPDDEDPDSEFEDDADGGDDLDADDLDADDLDADASGHDDDRYLDRSARSLRRRSPARQRAN